MSEPTANTVLVQVETSKVGAAVHVADLLHHVHLHAHEQIAQAQSPEHAARLTNIKRLAAELRDELRALPAP